MRRVSKEQATAIINNGFSHGFAGYPVLWADNGAVTIAEEKDSQMIVWEFRTDGSFQQRCYVRGDEDANISTSA
jgi:hypothetical protein